MTERKGLLRNWFGRKPDSLQSRFRIDEGKIEERIVESRRIVDKIEKDPSLSKFLMERKKLERIFLTFKNLPEVSNSIIQVASELESDFRSRPSADVRMAITPKYPLVIGTREIGTNQLLTSVMVPILRCTYSAIYDIIANRKANMTDGYFSAHSNNELLDQMWMQGEFNYRVNPGINQIIQGEIVRYNRPIMNPADLVAIGVQGFFFNEPLRINLK